ncbi:MAG TPA: biotin/lipoyl-containing protein [Candidatus Sulfotelmatobacter sp.]|jgi:biotin carboxyl carrier protein
MIYDIAIGEKNYRLELDRASGEWSCRLDGCVIEADAVLVRPGVLSLRLANQCYEVRCEHLAGGLKIWIGQDSLNVEVRDPRSLRGRSRASDEQGVKKLIAPMPGKVVRVLVEQGTHVEAGAGIMVVEAMKMQNEVKSPKKGKVQRLLVSQGATVNAGDVLAIVE